MWGFTVFDTNPPDVSLNIAEIVKIVNDDFVGLRDAIKADLNKVTDEYLDDDDDDDDDVIRTPQLYTTCRKSWDWNDELKCFTITTPQGHVIKSSMRPSLFVLQDIHEKTLATFLAKMVHMCKFYGSWGSTTNKCYFNECLTEEAFINLFGVELAFILMDCKKVCGLIFTQEEVTMYWEYLEDWKNRKAPSAVAISPYDKFV